MDDRTKGTRHCPCATGGHCKVAFFSGEECPGEEWLAEYRQAQAEDDAEQLLRDARSAELDAIEVARRKGSN